MKLSPHLSPQQRLIVDYLADGEFHCMANANFYMKDDRTRISELRRRGYEFESKPCDGRCKTTHTSTLYMRRITALPESVESLVKRQLEWARELPEQRPTI